LLRFPSTIRHWDSLAQRSNITDVNAALEHQYDAVLPLTYKLFASGSDYTNMSCTTSRGNSVENIHNLVHNAVGGYGHMSDASTSAFDPVFWLHHTNVDRLFAMWQAINPHSYIVPTINTLGSYAEPRGFLNTGESNLLPFHSDNGTTFWTSSAVRSTRKFGYTYQDVVDWNTTQETLASNVRANINRLYSPTAVNGTGQQKRRVFARDTGATTLGLDTYRVASTPSSSGVERQWSITVQMQRFAHRSPFLIDFFVGSPPISPLDWPTAPNLVGSHAQFIATNSDLMHPDGFPDAVTHGEVSLTHYLMAGARRGALANLQPTSVIPFLMKSLNWRARDMEGCALELESLAALSISVGSQVVRPAKLCDQFPTYSELEIYANITAGKPGGMGGEQSPDSGCGW
jgi:tyrosinase